MTERDIVVLVEEASASSIVQAVSKKLGLAGRVTILKHAGIGDLKRSIANKLKSNTSPLTKFLVLCDADQNDCKTLKRELLEKVPINKRSKTIIRIVCQELEAWYLAQPAALQASGTLSKPLPKNLMRKDPDLVLDPKQVFFRYAHDKGQMEHARCIGPHLDPDLAQSRSFGHFVAALRRLAAMAADA